MASGAGKGEEEVERQDVVEGCVLPGRPELRAEILPRTLNSANQFKKTKEHAGTQPLNNTLLSSSVETGIWDRSHRHGQLIVSESSEYVQPSARP